MSASLHRPIWKNHGAAGGKPASQASCKAVCADNGHRNGVEDTPGQVRLQMLSPCKRSTPAISADAESFNERVPQGPNHILPEGEKTRFCSKAGDQQLFPGLRTHACCCAAQARYVCRPAGGSSRIGWSGHQAGIGATTSGIACHFVSRNAVSGESLSVYSFDFQCLCI